MLFICMRRYCNCIFRAVGLAVFGVGPAATSGARAAASTAGDGNEGSEAGGDTLYTGPGKE